MSSEPLLAELQEAADVGAADFMVKPIQKDEVVPLWRHVSRHVWRSMQAIAGAGDWLHPALSGLTA